MCCVWVGIEQRTTETGVCTDLEFGVLSLQCGVVLLQRGGLSLQSEDLSLEVTTLSLQLLQLRTQRLLLRLKSGILGKHAKSLEFYKDLKRCLKSFDFKVIVSSEEYIEGQYEKHTMCGNRRRLPP